MLTRRGTAGKFPTASLLFVEALNEVRKYAEETEEEHRCPIRKDRAPNRSRRCNFELEDDIISLHPRWKYDGGYSCR